MKRLLLIPFLVGLFCTGYGFTEEPVCVLKSSQDILRCALERHPEILQAEAIKRRDAALVKIGKQRPNPELESKIITGVRDNEEGLQTESSLFHTLEIGGKRRARIGQARAQSDAAQARFLESKETVALHTVLALYRLRQIRSELEILREAAHTFGRILSQYRSRPLLQPEQEVSLSLFDMAGEEASLKETSLLAEEAEWASFLEIATGLPYSEIKTKLPSSKSNWPKLAGSKTPPSANSQIQLAQADLRLTQSNASLARSKIWPDLRVGPTWETQKILGRNQSSVGASVSLPLPLLSLNRGEIAYAKLDRLRSTVNLEAVLKKTAQERDLQVRRYQSALKSLRHGTSAGDLAAKHHEVEHFFERGLVPSSLVTESHHQLFEVTQARHKQELNALDALWRVTIIDGRVLEEKL